MEMSSKKSYIINSNENSKKTPKIVAKNTLEVEDDEELTSCGFGRWRPKWLQVFANPIFFLINMSLVGIIQSMSGPIYFSSMSTLEKRYSFDSKISGIILIADNISQFMLSPFFGYLAVRFNRARLIAVGEMFLAVSCIISAFPYFIYGPAQFSIDSDPLTTTSTFQNQSFFRHYQQSSFELCESFDTSNHSRYACKTSESITVWPAVFLLLLGSFFRGIGFTCYFVIGLPFLDDNVSKKNSPMYMSIVQSIRLIGPASGYLLSAFCLRYYENPLVNPGISRKDPRFVGAWWLSFVIVGCLLFVASIPLCFFPTQFKNASVKAATLRKKMEKSGGSLQAFKRFITNPIVMLYLGGNIFRYIGIGGYIMLKTKYIESQYRQSSSSASFITGTTSILPMAGGILLGGAIISIFKPKARSILIYVFLVEGLSIFTLGSGIFLGCDPIHIPGHQSNNGLLSMDSACNKNYGCTTHIFTPLCGTDGKTTYFSPCYAGCKTYESFNKTFQECSCFSGSVSSGYCEKDVENCQNLFYYLITVLSGAIISSTARTANALISFRSVDPMDKGFTMGAASSFLAIFAFIPYPLIFGYIADSVCLVWESKCNKKGNCWLYDQEKFRNYLHGTCVLFMAIGSIFDFIMIFFSSRVKNVYDEEMTNENIDGNIENNHVKNISESKNSNQESHRV